MADQVHEVDARGIDCIDGVAADAFARDGLLVLRGVLGGTELGRLGDETMRLIERATNRADDPDFQYGVHEVTGQEVPRRVEYVVDKLASCRVLAGHPLILRTVDKLQGPSFIPTWDAMVFKFAGAGKAVPWHRDAGVDHVGDAPIFNVDFYLDAADESSCVWAVPGSNHWPTEQADAEIARRNANGFDTAGAAAVVMQPGDVLLHNILTLHGSKPTAGPLRRVIYYEYRPIRTELAKGPHVPRYIPLKQRVLLATLRDRAGADYLEGERPFEYRPADEFAPPPLAADEALETYRYPHGQYWRDGRRR